MSFKADLAEQKVISANYHTLIPSLEKNQSELTTDLTDLKSSLKSMERQLKFYKKTTEVLAIAFIAGILYVVLT